MGSFSASPSQSLNAVIVVTVVLSVSVTPARAGSPTALKSCAAQAESPQTERTADLFAAASSIIVRRCLECHHSGRASGGLMLSSSEGLRTGGDSGVAVNRDDLSASYLLDRVRNGEMPPPVRGVPQALPDAELRVLQQWVAAGAYWPMDRVLDLYEQTTDVRAGRDFWSLQPVHRPPLPAPAGAGPSANPIDGLDAIPLFCIRFSRRTNLEVWQMHAVAARRSFSSQWRG